MSDAIAIAANSDAPFFAVELLNFIEQQLHILNPSDFSRDELFTVKSKKNSNSEQVFLGNGLLSRPSPLWPPYLIKKIIINPNGLLIERVLCIFYQQSLYFEWNKIEQIEITKKRDWRYRQLLEIKTFHIFSKKSHITVDISNNFPEIEESLNFLKAVECFYPLTYNN